MKCFNCTQVLHYYPFRNRLFYGSISCFVSYTFHLCHKILDIKSNIIEEGFFVGGLKLSDDLFITLGSINPGEEIELKSWQQVCD